MSIIESIYRLETNLAMGGYSDPQIKQMRQELRRLKKREQQSSKAKAKLIASDKMLAKLRRLK